MHYDDEWKKAHLEQFERERKSAQSRNKLLETLDIDTMIKIMFKDYLHKLSDYKVDKLYQNYVCKKW